MTTSDLNNIISWAPNCRYDGSLPAITGSLTAVAMNPFNYSGAFYVGTSSGIVPGPNSGSIQRRYVDFDASRSSGVYNRNDNHIIPSGTYSRPLIKYI